MIKTSTKLFATLVILIFVTPNLIAILKGRESYPFTPAPMFSHYVDRNANFYDFVFIAEGDAQKDTVIPIHAENKNPLAVKRFFFDKVYGSVEKDSPLWNNTTDNKPDFERRVGDFFKVYFKHLDEDKIESIRLEVKQYNHLYSETASHTVGFYDLSTKQFKQTWTQNQ